METKFFPMEYGVTVTVIAVVAFVAIGVLSYLFWKKMKQAALEKAALNQELANAKNDIKNNEDAIRQTKEELNSSQENFKASMKANLTVRHDVFLHQMVIQLEQMTKENENGKKHGFLDENEVVIKNSKLDTIRELIKSATSKI